jgi:hypothetical protein
MNRPRGDPLSSPNGISSTLTPLQRLGVPRREAFQPPNDDQAGDFKRRRGALAGGAPQVAAPHLQHDRPRVSRRPAYLLDDGNLRDRRGRSREAFWAPPHDEEGRYGRLTPTQPPGGRMTHIGRVEFVARIYRRSYPRRQRSAARCCGCARRGLHVSDKRLRGVCRSGQPCVSISKMMYCYRNVYICILGQGYATESWRQGARLRATKRGA